MIIYLSGSYSSRVTLREIGRDLEKLGYNIKCPAIWLTGEHDDACPIECATSDIEDILKSDMLLIFTEYTGSRGGMYVELGYALAKGIPCVVVGPYTNVFTRLCRRVDSVHELIQERTRT